MDTKTLMQELMAGKPVTVPVIKVGEPNADAIRAYWVMIDGVRLPVNVPLFPVIHEPGTLVRVNLETIGDIRTVKFV